MGHDDGGGLKDLSKHGVAITSVAVIVATALTILIFFNNRMDTELAMVEQRILQRVDLHVSQGTHPKAVAADVYAEDKRALLRRVERLEDQERSLQVDLLRHNHE